MVIFDAQIIFVIKNEHVSTNHLPWSYQDVMMYHFLLRLYLVVHKTYGTVFYILFKIIIYVRLVYGLLCK